MSHSPLFIVIRKIDVIDHDHVVSLSCHKDQPPRRSQAATADLQRPKKEGGPRTTREDATLTRSPTAGKDQWLLPLPVQLIAVPNTFEALCALDFTEFFQRFRFSNEFVALALFVRVRRSH
jgi:hypothetical protein